MLQRSTCCKDPPLLEKHLRFVFQLCPLPSRHHINYTKNVYFSFFTLFFPSKFAHFFQIIYVKLLFFFSILQELTKLKLSISLDVAAPKIIVPTSSSHDRGFALLDMGDLYKDLDILFINQLYLWNYQYSKNRMVSRMSVGELP